MSEQQHYGNLAFDADFVFVITPDQQKIKFTRYERALLTHFVQHRHLLQSRDRLLSVLNNISSTDNDRNIDYLLSRLRKKLGDSARNPQYIATQYGEGYMWVAKLLNKPIDDAEQIYLSLGPVYGASGGGVMAMRSLHFVDGLQRALRECFGPLRRIEQLPAQNGGGNAIPIKHQNASYAIELSFLSIKNSGTCSLLVLNRRTGRVYGSLRHDLGSSESQEVTAGAFNTLASTIKDTLWDSQIFRESEDHSISSDPINLGIYKASKLFEPGVDNFLEVEKKLRQRLDDHPDDARTAIMLASNLYTQHQSIDIIQAPDWATEVELLILDHLPGIQNDALYLASAAERLDSFGHHELAESLAERALEIGPSFAASYMVLGGIKVNRGLIDEGIAFYDLSIEMTDHDSLFYILLISLKSIAYQAVSEHEKVREIMPHVISLEPDDFRKTVLQLVFLTANVKTFRAEAMSLAKALPREVIGRLLTSMHTLFCAPFHHESHRVNIFQGVIELYSELHGEGVIPDVIKKSMPGLFLAKNTVSA